MSALALLLAGALCMQAPGQGMDPQTQKEWLNRSRGVQPTKYPTGVVIGQIPLKPRVVAHGPDAQQFVAQTFAAQDPSLPDTREQPWLVLIGPDDATRQAEQALPVDIAPKIHVNRYEPTTDVIRRFSLKRATGTQALVMGPDGTVEYEGLFELDRVVDAIRKLLGLEPEPDDDKPWFPNPLRPKVEVNVSWIAVIVAFIAGLFTPALLRRVLRGSKAWIREALKDEPPAPTTRPN